MTRKTKQPAVRFQGTMEEEADIRRRRIGAHRLPLVLVPAIWLAIAAYLALGGLRPIAARLAATLLVAVAGGYAIDRALRPRKTLRPARKRNPLTTRGPTVRYRFEVRPRGLWIERNAVGVSVAWKDVVGMDESGEDIVIQTRYDLSVIRGRAFASARDRKAFAAALRRHLRSR